MLKESHSHKNFLFFWVTDPGKQLRIRISPRIRNRIRKNLGYESEIHKGSIHDKNQRQKYLVQLSL
jgi:hypothetical protein